MQNRLPSTVPVHTGSSIKPFLNIPELAVFLSYGLDRLNMKKNSPSSPYPLTLILVRPVCAPNSSPAFKVQQDRKLWHDNIDKEQKRLLALDGKADEVIQASKDENVNLQIADVMIRQVDLLQEKIEMDSSLSAQMKIKNLRSLETMIRGL